MSSVWPSSATSSSHLATVLLGSPIYPMGELSKVVSHFLPTLTVTISTADLEGRASPAPFHTEQLEGSRSLLAVPG